ncbi:MAG TPA: TetR/AcrR family transcriptional regulator [Prolixibacteraceae bacterium]|nr:TetR/AcrR family transcriptional regulator [Prolixibacteraceae bacterium]
MPRTPEQYEEIRNEKKQKIMETALLLFATEGYHVASISMIAEKANISKGLMYNYFESKEDLLNSILDHGFRQLFEGFDPNRDNVISNEEFAHYIDSMFTLLDRNQLFWKLYFGLFLQPSLQEILSKKLMEWYAPLLSMLCEFFNRKGSEDPETEALIFGSLLDGIGFNYIMNPSLYPIEKVKKQLIRKYLNRE